MPDAGLFEDWLKVQTAKAPLPISRFMKTALSHPQFGYYSTQTAIGKSGDFITAPEISQLFGEMLAGLLVHIWQLARKPAACLFEAGPGRGTLLQDIDRTYHQLAPELARNDWYLLETSPALITAQSAALPKRKLAHIQHLNVLPPRALFGVANEFFDALGIDQAIFSGGKWHHRQIIWVENGQSCVGEFCLGTPLTAAQKRLFKTPETSVEGDILEYSPDGASIMKDLATHIAHFGGALLICDYGKTDNRGDTLQAVQNHAPVPFLSAPSLSDLTHWVDFDQLASVAKLAGARLIGPQPQGVFLRQLGIEQRAEKLRHLGGAGAADRALAAALDRLISPAQMGHAFKVGLLVPQGEGIPPGFFPHKDDTL